jgi:hypothetical protein
MLLCVRDYEVRRWNTYILTREALWNEKILLKSVGLNGDILCCGSDSKMATQLGSHPRRFYIDLECIAADIDPILATDIYRLAEEWRGHRAGSLVMVASEAPPFDQYKAARFSPRDVREYIAVEVEYSKN